MKPIIFDHVRRWWWVWIVGGIFYTLGIVNISLPANQSQHLDAFPVGIFLGVMLLCYDVQRGHARTLLSLPVTASQISRAWWWVSVGIPALALIVFAGIGIGIVYLIFGKPPMLWPALSSWLGNLLLTGVTFFALTGLPARSCASGNWKDQCRGVIFGLLFGGTCGGWMYFRQLDQTSPLALVIDAVAIILFFAGWYRAEAMVRYRASLPSGSCSSAGITFITSGRRDGSGGLRLLVQSIFWRMTILGLAMFLAVFVILSLIFHGHTDRASMEMINGSMTSMFTFQFLWMMSIQFFVYALHIRYLRVMPLSSATLARVLVFTPLAATAVVFAASVPLHAAMLHQPFPDVETLIRSGGLLEIAGATLTVPMLVWRGLDMINYAIGMAILAGGIFAIMYFKVELPLAINLLLPLALVAGSYLATKWLLERNSRVYRPRTGQIGGLYLGGR